MTVRPGRTLPDCILDREAGGQFEYHRPDTPSPGRPVSLSTPVPGIRHLVVPMILVLGEPCDYPPYSHYSVPRPDEAS